MRKRREEDPTVSPSSATGNPESRSESLLRPPEVAQLLACSTKTVYAWAASGFLPPCASDGWSDSEPGI